MANGKLITATQKKKTEEESVFCEATLVTSVESERDRQAGMWEHLKDKLL